MTEQPSSDASPQHPGTTPEQGFALILEQACSAFETLQALAKGSIGVICPGGRNIRTEATIRMALAQSFIFLSSRSYRICEHGKHKLNLPREERRSFMKALGGITAVRDVNEHGFDLNRQSGGKVSKPSMHVHKEHGSALDETSLVTLSEHVILMGPLNLWDVYQPVAAMRAVAGSQALARRAEQYDGTLE